MIIGVGYIGAALAKRALAAGERVIVADNWYTTRREQIAELEDRGAKVEHADVRNPEDLDRLLASAPARVFLLAAQASRPLADRDPDYTEEVNVTGTRRVAEALARTGVPAVFASSLHVYGSPAGDVGPDHPYGPQGDLAHLSKVYGELCLGMHARRAGFDLEILRLGIVYGPSPVVHSRPESQTVVDKFKRIAAEGRPLPLDDGGRATIGIVHIDDATRLMLEAPRAGGITVENVCAETVTVADVAALARGERPDGRPACVYRSPFSYTHRVSEYLGR